MSERNEVTKNNKYWIEKYRYLELKYFCLQYPIWLRAYNSLDSLSRRPADLALFEKYEKGKGHSDPTARLEEARIYYRDRTKLVEDTAIQTSESLWKYILEGVTTGASYDILKAKMDIPCDKDMYCEMYHKFFWLLNKARD